MDGAAAGVQNAVEYSIDSCPSRATAKHKVRQQNPWDHVGRQTKSVRRGIGRSLVSGLLVTA